MSTTSNDIYVTLPLSRDGATWMKGLMERIAVLDSDDNIRTQASVIAEWIGRWAERDTERPRYEVRVFGPNLTREAQQRGTFHVHTADCADCKKYGPGRRYGGEFSDEPIESFASLREIVESVYPPEDFGYNADDQSEYGPYAADFWLAPCIAPLLPDA